MKKIIIIGGGPGGYVAAIKAAQMGAEVHLIENIKLGGTCLNVGCIPTKALLHTGDFYEKAKAGGIPGVAVRDVSLDWPAAQREKDQITNRLVNGVTGLLKANKIQVHFGTARLISPNTVEVSGEGSLTADAVIVASGSEPVPLNFPGADLPQVIDSTQALSLERVPKSMVIIGGGVIGVEFGSLYHSLGVRVTIVEMLDEVLPPLDRQVASRMHQLLAEQGIGLYTSARLLSVKAENGIDLTEKAENETVLAEIEHGGETVQLECEKVLVAAGRRPRTKDLGLEALGIQIERGAILTDGNFETTAKGVFAVGDCNGQLMLAHAASAQGEAAVEYILTGKHHYNKNIIPSCVYAKPEIAAVGLTEEQAKRQGIDYQCGVFQLSGNGKSMIEGESSGFIKIIADAGLGEVIGAHMIGPRVTEMIGELAVAMTMEGGVEEIIRTIHAHPTVSEAISEAAQAVFGNSIHWPPKR